MDVVDSSKAKTDDKKKRSGKKGRSVHIEVRTGSVGSGIPFRPSLLHKE